MTPAAQAILDRLAVQAELFEQSADGEASTFDRIRDRAYARACREVAEWLRPELEAVEKQAVAWDQHLDRVLA